MAEPLLELRDVRASYGKIEVLHGVDLVVPQGSVVALLGPNGGGKTTTLKVASGQMVPTAGCVHVGGRHVNGAPADALARLGLCTIPEGRGIFPNLTVRENLEFAGRMLALADIPSAVAGAMATAALILHAGERVKTLSSGWQKRVALARLHMQSPMLLLLDEPYNSLDAEGAEIVNALLEGTRSRGGAAVVVTHSVAQAGGVVSRSLSLRAGLLDGEAQ